MSSHKLQSFQDFAKSNLAVKAAKVEEEQSIARDTAANQFKSLFGKSFNFTRFRFSFCSCSKNFLLKPNPANAISFFSLISGSIEIL